MRHRRHKRTLGLKKEHRQAVLNNLVSSLIRHNRITTTHARAKEASRLADKLVSLAKRNDLHAQRQIFSFVKSRDLVKRLVDEIAPVFTERAGGYTRVLKYRTRQGDGALMALLEFTELPEFVADKASSGKKGKSATSKSSSGAQEENEEKSSKSRKKQDASDESVSPDEIIEPGTKQAGFFSNLRRYLKK